MTAKATPEAIRSIVRRQDLDKLDPLNILTFCTHERYEQQLCKTGHNFYSVKHGKTWDSDYGQIPNNYNIIENKLPLHADIDLILCHTACERINISKRIKSDLNIPIILLTHVLPDIRMDIPSQVEQFKQVSSDIDEKVFISDFNRSAWGYGESSAKYIEHGMDCSFWMESQSTRRNNLCLSVVNDWPNRDWCCGWELWKETVGFGKPNQLPLQVVGKSPGLSEPAKSIEHLREIYHNSRIFYNTSIHSPVPTVLMEAMACGCAVVSTATCMIPEIIEHGVNGLISNDPKELRSFLDQLLSDEDMAKEMGENAQRTIYEKFNLDSFAKRWNKIFYNTVKNYKEY